MTAQMEYLHMQYPIDGLNHNLTLTGVPITISAIDSNGKVTDIGPTLTNAYYGTLASHGCLPKKILTQLRLHMQAMILMEVLRQRQHYQLALVHLQPQQSHRCKQRQITQ